MREGRESAGTGGAVAAAFYVVVSLLMLVQQPGRTTYDTRAELTERPRDFLAGAFTLWHPESNFGEFQNQAYGYLFPQGAWFVLTDLVALPDWVSQRLWSALVLIVACEGARRVGRAVGLADLPALLTGVAYALAPRLLGTVTVQTAESLPGAVMPWLVLPVVLHLRGRLSGPAAALLSGAAVVCMGGVNAVETAGSLPLAVILVLWGARRRLTSWRFAAGWGAAVGVACLWWALPLLLLARYAPPFYEYVESATDTTALVGWSEATRGHSSWLAYLLSGDQPWWPAAFRLATDPVLVLVAALVAGVGLAGLVLLETDLRRPLTLAALLGLGCLTVAHGGVAGAPVADLVRQLLDGPLQIFRNVHKIDPVVRLPLAIGFGHAASYAVARLVARRPRLDRSRPLLTLTPLLLVLALGQPFVANETRTPGWQEISSPWQQAQEWLVARQPAEDTSTVSDRTLVVPGSSFAQQEWGWTIDEPLAILGGTPVVSRSQVPLIPGESIRYLSALDQLIVTGRATESLVDQLARAGIRHVVLRRDLLRAQTRSPHPGGTAVSLARAGLVRAAGFGSTATAEPEVEVFRVPARRPALRIADADRAVTVRGAAESVLAVQGAGLAAEGRPVVLEGEPGWGRPADVVTDTDQRRERAFGNNDEGLSTLMTADEPWRVERAAHDFPGGPGDEQVVASYDDGVASVTASSSQGYADNYGAVSVQSAPYAAVDGDLDTRWVSSLAGRPEEQWLRIDLEEPRPVREVTVTPVADDPRMAPIRVIEVVAGRQRVRADIAPSGVPAVVRLDGSVVDRVEVRVVEAATAARSARVGLREVAIDRIEPERSFLVPGVVPADAAVVFTTMPGRRACAVTLSVPDCDVDRIRSPEEGGGLDRTFTTESPAALRIAGHVVARGTPEAMRLLDPIQRRPPVSATSAYGQDPKVAARFAYDGQPTTAWVSDDADPYPTLTFRWQRPRTVRGLTIRTGGVDAAPVAAVVTAGDRVQRVGLESDTRVPIDPVVTRTLHVRFERAPGSPRVVLPEIELAGVPVTRPFLADAGTGAVCGLGPVVEVDGREVATRVTGVMADVVNGSPLALEACDPDAEGRPVTVDLEAGEHRLSAIRSSEYDVTDLSLVPAGAATPAEEPTEVATRDVAVETWGSTRRTARVTAGPEAVLHLPENFNEGWVATFEGEELEPLRVDGWQQGWVVPAGGAGTVELTYAPQRVYDVLLPVGLAASGAVLLAGLLSLVALLLGWLRGRRDDPAARPWPSPEPVRWATWGVAAVAVLVALGPVAAVALVAASLGASRLRAVTAALVAAVAVGLSGGLDALAGPDLLRDAADIGAALAVGLVAGVVLGRPRAGGVDPSRGTHRAEGRGTA